MKATKLVMAALIALVGVSTTVSAEPDEYSFAQCVQDGGLPHPANVPCKAGTSTWEEEFAECQAEILLQSELIEQECTA